MSRADRTNATDGTTRTIMLTPLQDDTLRLVLVRHGVTDWNTLGRMQGHTDVPLSALGRLQAEAVADRLASERVDAVYTSDLARAADTGRAIANRHGLDIQQLPDLRETMLGEWEGMTDDEIRARGDGDALDRYRCDPSIYRPPGSESVEAVARRIAAARATVARQHATGCVVVVGHGGSLRAIFCEAIRAPIRCMFAFRLGNASVSVVDYAPSRSSIVMLNCTHHLDHLANGGKA